MSLQIALGRITDLRKNGTSVKTGHYRRKIGAITDKQSCEIADSMMPKLLREQNWIDYRHYSSLFSCFLGYDLGFKKSILNRIKSSIVLVVGLAVLAFLQIDGIAANKIVVWFRSASEAMR